MQEMQRRLCNLSQCMTYQVGTAREGEVRDSMSVVELNTECLEDLGSLFPGRQLEMVMDSILDGSTRGRLWTINPDDPRAVSLLWDQGNNKFYLSGEGASPHMLAALTGLVSGEIREEAVHRGRRYFGVRALSGALQEQSQEAFAPFLEGRRDLHFYACVGDSVELDWTPALDGTRIVPIDRDLLEGSLAGADTVREEILLMWPSVERYLERGWGTAAVIDGEIGCRCTAEYVGHRFCGVGIETAPKLQNRGLATATAARFVSEALARDRIPHWECDVKNVPSARVAEKLGLQRIEDASFLVGLF